MMLADDAQSSWDSDSVPFYVIAFSAVEAFT